MDEARFDGLVRAIEKGLTRRGVLAALGSLGLAAMSDLAEAKDRKRTKKRKPKEQASRVAVASVQDASPFVLEGASDAETIGLNNKLSWSPVWRHAHLTVRVKAGNDAPAKVAAMHQAIAIWSDVLDRHFGGVVTLTDITDEQHAAQTADIHVSLTHKQGTKWSGVAICGDDACDRVYVKTDTPPGQLHKFPDNPGEFTPEFVGQLTLHELGHALGLDHASPLIETNDIMGYGFLLWIPVVRTPVISDCDLQVLDEFWAWALEGVEPYQSTTPFVVC